MLSTHIFLHVLQRLSQRHIAEPQPVSLSILGIYRLSTCQQLVARTRCLYSLGRPPNLSSVSALPNPLCRPLWDSLVDGVCLRPIKVKPQQPPCCHVGRRTHSHIPWISVVMEHVYSVDLNKNVTQYFHALSCSVAQMDPLHVRNIFHEDGVCWQLVLVELVKLWPILRLYVGNRPVKVGSNATFAPSCFFQATVRS